MQKDVHHLKCCHRPMTIGYGKWKAEEAHTSPDILMFHDVLNDREILDILAMARDDVKLNFINIKHTCISLQMFIEHLIDCICYDTVGTFQYRRTRWTNYD